MNHFNLDIVGVSGGGGIAFIQQRTRDILIQRRGILIVSFYYLSIVQDTRASTTQDKPGSSTCPVYSNDTQEHFSWEEPVHISFLVIVVGVCVWGGRTRNP